MSSANTAQSGFAEVNGARLYYEVAGQGHPLVLTHESIGDNRMYDDQFGVFAQHYKTIRYDMRGFGQSSVPSGPFSFSDDLYGLLRFLGIGQAHVLGMSMGGGASIDLTLSHPEMVSALVVSGSALGGFDSPDEANDPRGKDFEAAAQAGDHERLADLAVEVWVVGDGRVADQVNPAVRQRIRELELHNLSLGADESLAQQLDPPAIGRLSEIHAPTLVIVGDRDISDIQQIADLLAQGIAGAQKVVIRNTAHVPNMEQPEQFNRIVLDFLVGV
ncbi:MAG: alpha/beta fold hydrolase [Ktedonobacterales bacterium]